MATTSSKIKRWQNQPVNQIAAHMALYAAFLVLSLANDASRGKTPCVRKYCSRSVRRTVQNNRQENIWALS